MSGADAGLLVAHCQARMLHPAALMDFESYVQGLLARGERDQAVRLWRAVVVVVHLPPTEASEFRIHSLGSLREVPCMVEGCARCTEMRGGFQFPWLGTWTKRAVLVQAEVGPEEAAWDLYYAGRDYLDEDQLRAVDSGMRVQQLVPEHVARFIGYVELAGLEECGLDREAVFWAWRRWQAGRVSWQEPAYEPIPSGDWESRDGATAWAGKALGQWLAGFAAGERVFPPPCMRCGALTRNVIRDRPICEECLSHLVSLGHP